MAPAAEAPLTTASRAPVITMASVDDVFRSDLNPRKHHDAKDDADLTASVKEEGILEPLLARPHPRTQGFELIAGERRYNAAVAAGLTEVPLIVRDVTDAQLVKLAFTENDQRRNMHPIDDARGFASWLALDPKATPESIAAELGRSTTHIKNRLKLLELAPLALDAFEQGRITVSHAERIARVPADSQEEALAHCFTRAFDLDKGGMQDLLMPVRQLEDWVNHNIKIAIDDPDLQTEFPELAEEVAKARLADSAVLMLSEMYLDSPHVPGEPLPKRLWDECTKKDKGAQAAIIVIGRRRGRRIYVTLKPAPVPETRASSAKKKSPAAREKERLEREARERQDALHRAKRSVEQAVRRDVIVTAALGVKKLSDLALREVALNLCANTSDTDEFARICELAGLPADLEGRTELFARLSPLQVLRAIVVMTLDYNEYDSLAKPAKAFGVDLKAIEKPIRTEAAAKGKLSKSPTARTVAMPQDQLKAFAALSSVETLSSTPSRLAGIAVHESEQFAITGSMSQGALYREVDGHRLYLKSEWPYVKVKPLTYSQHLAKLDPMSDAGRGHFGILASYRGVDYVIGEPVRFVANKAAAASKLSKKARRRS